MMIVVGKADQIVFERVRSSVTDAAAPLLDMLARPAAAFDSAASRSDVIVGELLSQPTLSLATAATVTKRVTIRPTARTPQASSLFDEPGHPRETT